ncbi:SAM-dependent methyltransferase [Nonomuraea polychroma]|uniref:SAM-dependent methyltransferase n=1 Tax=Nonomuraea polychroma TaxID=46176 RepID=UPI003D90F22F
MTEPGHGVLVDDGPTVPATHAAVYNAVHGGKDNFGQDRKLAAELLRIFPGAPAAARANQAFLRRAVRSLSDAGIYQFIDLGSGYPVEPHLHTVAAAGARFAYVDHNPTVCSHLRALCRAAGVASVEQDLRYVDAVLDDPELAGVINPVVPTAVICGAVLHVLTDEEATRLIGKLRERLPPGSLLVFSIGTSDGLPESKAADAVQLYTEHISPVVLRAKQQILQLLGGCALLPPGLVKTYAWFPDDPTDVALAVDDAGTPHLYAGLAGFLPDRRSLTRNGPY